MQPRNGYRSLAHLASLLGLVGAAVLLANGCETGGKEGDRCNALVEQDECHAGLHCQQVTCDRTYCCPLDRTSTDPNCKGDGCPSADAGEEAGDAAQTSDAAGADAGDAGVRDATADDASDASKE